MSVGFGITFIGLSTRRYIEQTPENVLAIAAMLCSYKMVSQMLFESYSRCSCCKESPSLLPTIQNPRYSDNRRTYQYSRS
jgi:hypothetical protein